MPVPERVKAECRKTERAIMLPYAAVIFTFWQGSKYFELDRFLFLIGLMLLLHLASMHIAGQRHRPSIAIAALVSLFATAISAYLFSDLVSIFVGFVSLIAVHFLAYNLRRRQVVRESSPDLRSWPN